MKYRNSIRFEVSGRHALFTDPLTRSGGEKCSLPVPTYEALKGMISAVYWQPHINWVIDNVRIMEQIRTESRSVLTRRYFSNGYDMSVYTYLKDVRYQVQAHFEPATDCFTEDDEHKHYRMALRMLERGGRRNIFLGTADCPCDISACNTSDKTGFYDNISNDMGIMFHSFTYSEDEYPKYASYFRCHMNNGIIHFPQPHELELVQPLHTGKGQKYALV